MTACLAAIASGPALAQSATDSDKGTFGDDEIVVTAQKREQTLIDVPQSISVVSGDLLERSQANNFQDFLNHVPGLQLNQATPGAGRLVLRGLNTGGVASTVGVYVDETPFGSSTALANGAVLAGDFDTFDIARVEVLRGPQGTLYGASTLGGLIKYVTNAPKLGATEGAVRGAAEATKGGAMSYHGNAMINLPLGETLAFRASGFYHKNGGWIDSIGTAGTSFASPVTSDVASNINDSKVYGGRASLLFKPNEMFDVRLTAYLQNIRANADSSVESDPATLRTLYGRPTQSQFSPDSPMSTTGFTAARSPPTSVSPP
jgi:outer membrane receptor protein involved in Fe transport